MQDAGTEGTKSVVDSAPRHATGGVVGHRGEWLSALPLGLRVLLSVVLVAFVAVLDAATGSEVSFSIFYLVPVVFAGTFVSRRAGLVVAILSAVTWGYLEIKAGGAYSAAWIPYWNSATRLGFFVLVNELMVRLRQARAHERALYAHERALARQDSLTGMANSRVFEEYAGQIIALSRRSGRPFTIAYVDLDRFKQVNDEFGHSEGDTVLQVVSTLIRHGLRSTDMVARVGGDEFGILMPDTEAEQGRVTLERIVAAIAEGAGNRWDVGVTVGAVTFTEPPADVEYAVRQADALMYQGKAAGRGRVLQTTWPETDGRVSEPAGVQPRRQPDSAAPQATPSTLDAGGFHVQLTDQHER